MKHTSRENEIIRERLRLAREETGLSQNEVALLLNKPQWFVSRSETGTRCVDIDELIRFGKIYAKPLRYFLDGFLD